MQNTINNDEQIKYHFEAQIEYHSKRWNIILKMPSMAIAIEPQIERLVSFERLVAFERLLAFWPTRRLI